MPVILSDPIAAPEPVGEAPFLTASDVAAEAGGRLLRAGTRPIRGASVDSRAVEAGQLFVALPGERTDGHDHLADAVSAGAAGVLLSRDPGPETLERLGDVTVVLVDDGLRAFHALAAAWRRRFALPVVGVTGSVAKSSTKEAIATLLSVRLRVLRSEGNANNEIGLPLAVMRLGPEHQIAVLEMGMYVGGEIAQLAVIALPSIGVVTAVRPIHLSRAGSIQAIEDAKAELVEALPPEGLAVLNADDPRVRRMVVRTAARSVTYGFDPGADVRAERIVSRGLDGMEFVLVLHGERRDVCLPRLGRHAVHNALAAAAVGREAGLPIGAIVEGLERPWALPHRSAVVRLGEMVVLDDTYNAGPDSMAAALATLADLPGRHIAVLGEMAELGELSDEAHRAVGRRAGDSVDLLVAVGEAAGAMADAALEAGLAPDRLMRVDDADRALAALQPVLRPGDVVLVKASRAAGLERVVDELVAVYG